MTQTEKIQSIQRILNVDDDGKFGPNSKSALDALIESAKHQSPTSVKSKTSSGTVVSSGGWGFSVRVDGSDLVIDNARVTCFGGSNDKMDSGETVSGVSTKPPGTLGCALPRNYTGSSFAQLKALGGSPIPSSLPFKTPVKFTKGNTSITVPFIDVGPAKWTGNEGDLTIAAARKFDSNATANNFEETGVEIRILGGAQYL